MLIASYENICYFPDKSNLKKRRGDRPMSTAETQGLDLVTLLSIIAVILIIFFFPTRWAERIETAFGKLFSRPRPDVIDVEKIAKSIRKPPER